HVTFSRECFGPDVIASITTSELRQLVEGVRFIERAKANPIDKEAMASELSSLRQTFTKSLVARFDLAEGTFLREEDIALKKPGTGIPAARLNQVVGRKLRVAVKADQVIQESDLA